MTPQSCPICNRLSIRRLLENFQISAAIICEIAGHIFFVRTADLESFSELPAVRSVPDGNHPLH
jgi:hypothetical protein